MTDNEARYWQLLVVFMVGLIIGSQMGAAITESRINSEIRTDQSDLQAQVAEIMKDKAVIDSLTQKLILHIEQLKLEREDLRKLQLKLSNGEG